ncbi:MAG TPA: enoyl-CoA hydratase/isomerase family protein [Candidatus Eremiobacteraeota bacterium]|nr:MAG: putative enoyl-CoA hydratase echA8 [bacterium ADurb.Bin363]HPZ09543.1 enoyl-CoA hydratase/isomerase family protein [Candidatus Eremiobacteraeota bacterium]
MSKDLKYIEFNVEKDVSTIILNRPPLNVLNIEMLNELGSTLKSLQDTGNIKLLVISAKGKAFSAGLDIKDHSPEKIEKLISVFHRVFYLLNGFKVLTLSVVQGEGAFGGGCELATFCDIVIASEEAKFVQPELKVGVIPPIAAITYQKMIGKHGAYEMLFTGKEYKAAQAARIGLITKAVVEEKLDIEVNRVIKKITASSTIILKMLKQAMTRTAEMNFEDSLKEVERIYTKSLIKTSDLREGLNAFLEKRKPLWKNK